MSTRPIVVRFRQMLNIPSQILPPPDGRLVSRPMSIPTPIRFADFSSPVAYSTLSSPFNLVNVAASALESLHIFMTFPIYRMSLHTLTILLLLPVCRILLPRCPTL